METLKTLLTLVFVGLVAALWMRRKGAAKNPQFQP